MQRNHVMFVPFNKTFDSWPVRMEMVETLFSYVIAGLHPGGFYEAVFCNDLANAAFRTHPSNEWIPICEMMRWLYHVAPPACWGSEEAVGKWLAMSDEERFAINSMNNLIFTDEQITWHNLNASS